jgi:hypothetical protein
MTSLLRVLASIAIFFNLSRGVEGVQLNGYDYIVVGSGPGGGPLAARLGLAGNKVLVIEAGGDIAPTDWNISVPYFNSKASEDPQISWDFYVRSVSSLPVLPLIRIGQPLPNRGRECDGSEIPLSVSKWHLSTRAGSTC